VLFLPHSNRSTRSSGSFDLRWGKKGRKKRKKGKKKKSGAKASRRFILGVRFLGVRHPGGGKGEGGERKKA